MCRFRLSLFSIPFLVAFFFFFFNDTATTEIYTLSLHDALPISDRHGLAGEREHLPGREDLVRPRSLGPVDGRDDECLAADRTHRDDRRGERDRHGAGLLDLRAGRGLRADAQGLRPGDEMHRAAELQLAAH